MKTEHLTRKEIIDSRLKKAGWNVAEKSQVVEEYEIITDVDVASDPASDYAGHQYSDYVLLGKNGKPVAVIEAKKTSSDASIGREQAKQYCQNIQKNNGGDLPFCFYTNGHDIFFLDLGNYRHQGNDKPCLSKARNWRICMAVLVRKRLRGS